MTFFTIQKPTNKPATPIRTGASDEKVVEAEVPILAINVVPVAPSTSMIFKIYLVG